MPRDKSEIIYPKSVRFPRDENENVELYRGDMSESDFIRFCVRYYIDNNAAPPVGRRRNPIKDETALSRVFARLGQTHYASNLNQLARLANQGALEVTPDTEAALRETCDHINGTLTDFKKACGFKCEP
ncbi:hypothetical protein OVA03_12800 [Asticcacaulis sp. SL142]|uniref:hypothetical protein n=1 Tax=Asticcacaulis sp. SL142 TaxID=2995155 RepID=UPI00226CB462|nr:hypothetical protein [Asticcacaulis sp. SL142]WAC47575.1 hypothetical protein OVA03_12800 [Asticcacaulis sp. SL142]